MGQRIAGVCFLKVDGTQYSLRGSMEVQPTVTKREGIAGQDGVHGFKEMPQVPFIEGEFTDMGNLSMVTLAAITDSTVTAELANGTTYILANAWWAVEGKVDTVEGKVPFKFEGLTCIEDLA